MIGSSTISMQSANKLSPAGFLLRPHIVNPILPAGGSRTRLWPLSRKGYPKQFPKLLDEKNLFEASAQSLSGGGLAAKPLATVGVFLL